MSNMNIMDISNNKTMGSAFKRGALIATAVIIGMGGAAQAANVELDGSGNVIRVTNLDLDFDNDALDGFYNVDFITGVGADIYGFDPADFDFSPSEENSLAIIQLNNALNLADTVPVGAGSIGSDQYFIPAIEFNFPFPPLDIWGAFGGENIAGLWGDCERNCLIGTSALRPDDVATFAKFSISEVPVPAAAWLFGSALLGLAGIGRKRVNND
jgi:hypothetical protein